MMRAKEDEQTLHQLRHEEAIHLVHGIRRQVIMGISVKSGISYHDCLETLIPEGCMVAEPH